MHYYLDFEKPVAELENKIEELKRLADGRDMNITSEIKKIEKKAKDLRADIFSKITPWQKTLIARHPERPYTLDYIRLLMEDFIELHGDRRFAGQRSGLFRPTDGEAGLQTDCSSRCGNRLTWP